MSVLGSFQKHSFNRLSATIVFWAKKGGQSYMKTPLKNGLETRLIYSGKVTTQL